MTTNALESLTATVQASFFNRDYERDGYPSQFAGVHSADGYTVGLDLDWSPSADWSVFAFYSYESLKNSLLSLKQKFEQDYKDNSHTIGLGVAVHPVNRPWEFDVQYVYGLDTTKIDVTTGAKTDVPDARYHTQYAQMKGSYKVSQSIDILGTALYGKVNSTDARWSGEFVKGSEALTPLLESPNYTSALVFLGLRYKLPM